ncbi:(2Fe-2S)-binding protein [Planctomicrobium piriforme]|uniref:BFD-like [2Fe-2S] binding domain-containing protein n=1 Tax=Planctomicrobium piriforme TaxID=1576369 RepID=A0A1I3G5X2_9PLAN|nr:(2Fe-2S)-binding protein [Planctomicrobium piriforme]SFI18895.1 BFD-like [2Fe-2S] binding domain-containing protein [Planctomicrobium piriforme]
MAHTVAPADPVLCHCLQVRQSTVDDCVTLLGASTFLEVREACGAGGGCMSCRRRIQMMIERRNQACPRITQD